MIIGHRDPHPSGASPQSSARSSNISASSIYCASLTSSRSDPRYSVTSAESLPSTRQRIHDTAPRGSLGQQPLFPDFTSGGCSIHLNPTPQCSYWCTVCEPKRRFQTSGGWIKHEKEAHEENVYVCMPDGPTLLTENGLVCVLCGSTNPDARHLEAHNTVPCLQKALTARTYTRKYQLEKHLEMHQVPKGSTMASQWRRGCNKQAWACGFCVAHFSKATKRFQHIASMHYERGEDISTWDPSKVILGLLQQPRVRKPWTERLALQFPKGKVELRWDTTPSRSLITMLELGLRGTEDGEALAMAAFIQSDYYQGRSESRSTTVIEGVHRETETKGGMMQDLSRRYGQHEIDQHQRLSLISLSPSTVKPHRLIGPQPPGHEVPQAASVHPPQPAEPSVELPSLNPSRFIPCTWSPKSERLDNPLYQTQSILQQEPLTRSNPLLFEVDYASCYGLIDTEFPLSPMAAPLHEEIGGIQPSNSPVSLYEAGRIQVQERLPNHQKVTKLPSSPDKCMNSNYLNGRSGSPMDVDLDLELLSCGSVNEEFRQENQWRRDMYTK